MDERFEMISKNVGVMNGVSGYDVVIVCCSSDKQAAYWQQRLENGKGTVIAEDSLVLAVEEDWEGGAGNALGTLYAVKQALALAETKLNHSKNILEELRQGKISIGLFHTAGKGTRLAPLPGSENNNKPGVKLPATITVSNKDGGASEVPITILEAVIKQTGCYAKCRKGRLSVFWGDQVFIPTVPVEYQPTHHADILCSLGPMPNEQEWIEKGMDKYGLIAQNDQDQGAQVEKVSHATAVKLLASLGKIKAVGASLGSFSISHDLLDAFLVEFKKELDEKKGKLDSDPHWWMPMTLSLDSYVEIMKSKKETEENATAHFRRIERMMTSFSNEGSRPLSLPAKNVFGAVDVGQGVCWWDYGQLKLYHKNTLLMTADSTEASLVRSFLGFKKEYSLQGKERVQRSTIATGIAVDNNSCVSGSSLGVGSDSTGFVKGSVLANVRCKHIEADNCVLINITADRIVAKPGSIIYNVIDSPEQTGLDGSPAAKRAKTDAVTNLTSAAPGEVIVGVFNSTGTGATVGGDQQIVRSHLETDGGKAWETAVHGNIHSFEQINKLNADACPTTLSALSQSMHDARWRTISTKQDSTGL